MNANLRLAFAPVFAAVLLLSNGMRSSAATVLFDFESATDFGALHDEGKETLGPGKRLERSLQFATSGEFALNFIVPRWEPGRPQWPAFECRLPLTNWSAFDRLAFDVTNPREQTQSLFLFVSDSKTPTRNGLAHTAHLEPFSLTRVVIPLAPLAEKKVNPADMRVLHFFTTQPPADLTLFIDRIVLLRENESLPAVSPSYLKQFAAMQSNRVEKLQAALKETRARVAPQLNSSAMVAKWGTAGLTDLETRITAFGDSLARADRSVLEASREAATIDRDLRRFESLIKLEAEFEPIRGQVQANSRLGNELIIGFASSMKKILPREPVPSMTLTNRVAVSLARNEKESFQVLVIPSSRRVKRVQLAAGGLRSLEGVTFQSSNVTAVPVGYVQTQAVPPYGSPVVGWWPDPILDFLSAADIEKGDAQSFWVRVRAPRDQPPGRYEGKLDLLVDGVRVFSFGLAVQVWPFTLPDVSPLPLAITFSPQDHPMPATQKEQQSWRKSRDYPVNAWKKHKLQWADFLADYYISYDSLYHSRLPDYEVLEHLHRQGRLGRFNLGYYGYFGTNAADAEQWKRKNLPRFREAASQARERGLLDHAYIYGCDEAPAKLFGQVQQVGQILKDEFPDVLLMTTTYDQSYGMDSVIQSMDAFCPLTPSFDMEKAARARAAGKQVWWYICCGPHHPHANMFIEFPAIEGRILMGAMTARYRPDGFLYYEISIWNSRKPITSGPFTDWDPRSWTTYHGDGSWTCVGPDGIPLPTVRLENFRDGLEDYAYVRILEATIAKVATSPATAARTDWLRKARALLQVPTDVLKSKTEFSHDPSVLYQWRASLAEAIASAASL